MEQDPNRFQILSLDGGGIKGIFAAAVLAAIEDDYNIRIVDHFDLLAGTSTGGVIAVALGMGMRPRDIVEFYLKEGPKIFAKRRSLFAGWARPKYPSDALRSALQSAFGDRLLGDSKKRLIVPAYSLTGDDVYIFKTPHARNLRRDYRVEAWKVALATASAPTFFPATDAVDGIRLVDGGVWANNPILVAIVEASSVVGVPLESLRVLSVGTSSEVRRRRPELDHGGVLAWARCGDAVDIIMRGQSIAANNQAQLLLGRRRVVRVDPVVPEGLFQLDGVSQLAELIALAQTHSRRVGDDALEPFICHRAQKYEPMRG